MSVSITQEDFELFENFVVENVPELKGKIKLSTIYTGGIVALMDLDLMMRVAELNIARRQLDICNIIQNTEDEYEIMSARLELNKFGLMTIVKCNIQHLLMQQLYKFLTGENELA